MFKKYLVVFAVVAALCVFSSCHPEDDIQDVKASFDHLELRVTQSYPQIVIDNFDMEYKVLLSGETLASGAMSGVFTPIEVKEGITEGKLEVHIDFKAKESFRASFQTWTDYVVSKNVYDALYMVNSDGSEQELISFETNTGDYSYSTFVEEHIPELIASMEDVLSTFDSVTLKKDRRGHYTVEF